jgi:hypothetical protein
MEKRKNKMRGEKERNAGNGNFDFLPFQSNW